VAELGLGVAAKVGLDLFPIAFVVAYFFAAYG